jgi:RimJ/RimL family protein N-acetyltransferase
MNNYTPFDTRPVILEGERVRLEPLSLEHIPALAEVAFEPQIWRWMASRMNNREDLRRYVEIALAEAAADVSMPWVTRSKTDGRIVGSTRFMDINREHRTLEIGNTWIHPDYQQSGINVAAKYLQLWHAFEGMGTRRVALKTHHQNLASQRAIRALGAKEEGTFRNHMVYPDGSTRNSVWFSVIQEEWPDVQGHMEERMRRHNAGR